MSYCLNPNCQKPQNPIGTFFCQNCGTKLLLKERYRAIKLIGQGGFGRTFLAVDEQQPSKPRCVIKQFFPQAQGTDNTQKAAELFEQEAVRLNQLGKHPQIPELLAYCTQDNRQYLVQEFIDGQNLAQVLEAEGAFNETQIRQLLNSLLPVVQFIHSHNIIHRDIKPENIIRRTASTPPKPPLVRGSAEGGGVEAGGGAEGGGVEARGGQLVLVDFGAAKFASGTVLAKTGTVIGSAGYAAPEQTRGKAVLPSDIYSLGVTCIHLLTEVYPFDLFSDSEDRWIWRDYLNNPVSRQLGRVLDKMLERATSRRYQSAAEVLKDLNSQRRTVASTPSTPSSAKTKTQPTQPWRCIDTIRLHERRINAIAFSSDGQILASGGADQTIKLWYLTTGEILTLKGHRDSIRAIAFSPDGQMLVSGSNDCTIKIWRQPFTKTPLTLKGHYGFVNSIAMTPDGRLLASACEGEVAELKLWQLPHGTEINYSDTVYYVSCVAFSPDGQLLAIGRSFGGIKLWQMPTRQEICTLTPSGTVSAIAFSPDGKLLASGSAGKTIKIWQIGTEEELRSLKTRSVGVTSLKGHSDRINSLAFSPDGKILASASDDKTIKIWQLATGKLICTLTGHLAAVQSVAFSPNGLMLVSGSWDTTIKIWRYENKFS